jgi:hypothetical protein
MLLTSIDIVNMRIECVIVLVEYIRSTFDLEFLFTQVMNAPLTESEQKELIDVEEYIEEIQVVEEEDAEYFNQDEEELVQVNAEPSHKIEQKIAPKTQVNNDSPQLSMVYIEPETPKKEEKPAFVIEVDDPDNFEAGIMVNPITPRLDTAPSFNSTITKTKSLDIIPVIDMSPNPIEVRTSYDHLPKIRKNPLPLCHLLQKKGK